MDSPAATGTSVERAVKKPVVQSARPTAAVPLITSTGQYDAWITPYYSGKDIVGYHYFTAYVAPGEYNLYDSLKIYIDGTLQPIEISHYYDENIMLEEGCEYTFDVKVGKDRLIVPTEFVTINDYFGNWETELTLNAGDAIVAGKTKWDWDGLKFGTPTNGSSVIDLAVDEDATMVAMVVLPTDIETATITYELSDGTNIKYYEQTLSGNTIESGKTYRIAINLATAELYELRVLTFEDGTEGWEPYDCPKELAPTEGAVQQQDGPDEFFDQ